jgi:hypothetical protein
VKSRKWKIIGAVVLLVFLVSCAGQVRPSVEIPVPISPSASATRTPRPTKTPYPTWSPIPTLINTFTLEPSLTHLPTDTPTSTLPPETQSAILARENAMATATVVWQSCAGAESPNYEKALSPNGEWMAIICNPKDDSSIYTKVFRLDGTKEWKVSFVDAYLMVKQSGKDQLANLVVAMNIFHWSNDGEYVYFSPKVRYLDGPGLVFDDGAGLFRLDLNKGDISAVLEPGINAYAFSKNDKYLSYIVPAGIEIQDVKTGEIVSVPVNETTNDMGMFSWSPDNKKLAFVIAYDDWYDEKSGSASIYIYNLSNNSLSLVLSKDSQKCKVDRWASETEILLKALNSSGCEILIDTATMKISPVITSTPQT